MKLLCAEFFCYFYYCLIAVSLKLISFRFLEFFIVPNNLRKDAMWMAKMPNHSINRTNECAVKTLHNDYEYSFESILKDNPGLCLIATTFFFHAVMNYTSTEETFVFWNGRESENPICRMIKFSSAEVS